MGVLSWLPSSQPDNDTFLIADGLDYCLQTQALFPGMYQSQKITNLGTSNDGKHSIYYIDSLTPENGSFIDSTKIGFPRIISEEDTASFSRDGKLFAIWLLPASKPSYDEVWVYNVSDPSKPIDTINFQDLYCTYSFCGVYPVFLTDSTIAVSMQHDGDESSALWEITIDGRIVRQLTFLPEYPSGVASASTPTNSLSLNSYSDPITFTTTISFILPEPSFVSLKLYNATGSEVAKLANGFFDAGEHELRFDRGNLPDGVYFYRLEANGQSQTQAMVIMR